MLGDVVYGIGPSVQKKNDSGLSGCQNRLYEVVLVSQEIEVVAIAGMSRRPGFAGSLLIAAECENYDVGLTGNFGRILDPFGIERGVTEHNFVGIPVRQRFGNFAAFGVKDGRARS